MRYSVALSTTSWLGAIAHSGPSETAPRRGNVFQAALREIALSIFRAADDNFREDRQFWS